MFRLLSFGFATDATFSDQSTAAPVATGLNVGPGIVVPTAAIQGARDAVASALAVDPTGTHHPKVFTVPGGPDVTFGANLLNDPTDDTITFGGLAPWSRSKAQGYVAGCDAFALTVAP